MNLRNKHADSQPLRAAMERIKGYKIFFGVIITTIVLGIYGFSTVFPQFNALTWLYMTIQLFLLDPQSFDVSDTLRGTDANTSAIPWTLELARWMAASVTCYGIIFATWRLLQKSSGALKIQKLRGHIIVFGSGPTVAGLLDECQENNSACVLLAPCYDLVEDWRAQGGLAVEINSAAEQKPLNREHLRLSGLEQASAFYAFDEHDGNNLRAAMLAENFNTTARLIIRQDEPYTCELLQRNGLLSPAKGSPLRVISVAYTRARILLRDVPLECHPQKGLATEVHLVIPELGTFEKAVAIHAALIGHYPAGERINLWLASSASHSSLLNDFPGIKRCVNLRLIGENGIDSIQDISSEARDGALVTIMATHLLPEDGYLQTLRFRERWSPKNSFRIVLSGPLADGEAIVTGAGDLVVAPQLKGLATPDSLDEHDMVAKKIHETWHEGNQRRIDKAQAEGQTAEAEKLQQKSTFKPWGKLTEKQKDDNRTAADHIEIKIRAVGLDPGQPDLLQAWEKLTPEQLDLLSEMEHERWCAPLWLRGSELGDRDDDNRKHPNLLPYDELDQSTKDYDTEQVKMAAQYLVARSNQGE
jgi:hypothetical protein